MVFPFVSGLLLVFVGMLIGYFLSNRETGDHEHNRLGLAKENADLKHSLQRGHHTLTELEAKYSRQNGQLNVLQQLCDDWSTSREESERERTRLEVVATEHHSRCEELKSQLADQTQRRIELEDQIHHVKQQQVEKLSEVESTWLQKFSGVESLLSQRQNDLDHVGSEKGRVAKQLQDAEARIAELTSELDSQRTLHDTITSNASGLKQEYTTLETSMKHANMRLKDAEAKCAKAISAKNLAEESLEALRAQLDGQRNENVELKGTLAGLNSLKQQYGAVQASLTSSDERLQIVASERDRAIGAEKAAHEHISGLQKQIENQESTIKSLRKSHDEAFDKLRCEIEKRAESEKEFERSQMTVRQELESRSSQLVSIESERDQLVAQLTEQRDDLATKLEEEVNQRSHFEQRLRQTCDDLETARGECDRMQLSFEEETSQRSHYALSFEQTSTELADFKTRCSVLESQLDSESEQRNQLESHWKQSCDEVVVLQAECERLRHSISGENRELGEARSELDALRTMLEAENARRLDLEEQKDQLEMSLRTLKARCDQMMIELSDLQTIRDQHSMASDKWKQYRVRLEQTLSQRDNSLALVTAKRSEIEQLQTQLGSANETIRQLRDRLEALEAKAKAEPENVILSLSEARTTVDHEYGGHTRVDEIRGIVFTERPNIVDDLKLISGVAEVLEGKLNDYGVYTFRQVMEWNETNIDEFKQLLPAFKDRIVREDWIGQASHLYDHFHGEGSQQRAA
jgi:chromosome segregation ATPase